MRPFLISRRMTSTTTLRRCSTASAIAVSPALPIMTASPRAPLPQTPTWAPIPAHIGSYVLLPLSYRSCRRHVRTTQEAARYLRGSVDCHVHKAGCPVDESGITIYQLWTRRQTRLSRKAPEAVENAAAMWTGGGENSKKLPMAAFPGPLLTVTAAADISGLGWCFSARWHSVASG